MKKVINLFFMMMVLLASTTFASCSSGDDEPSSTQGKVTITNKSTYTLEEFRVLFMSVSDEVITIEKKGTLKPGAKETVDIPLGAKTYYMSTYLGGYNYFSADYEISVRSQVLTDDVVGLWSR